MVGRRGCAVKGAIQREELQSLFLGLPEHLLTGTCTLGGRAPRQLCVMKVGSLGVIRVFTSWDARCI